ncbi:hypothetical protein PV08_09445 [Exophiala spinifera]|uniref:CMP/dCMP-type deaminase domain-containing protein n=1 Tax=Exophiala spinifera TaxID=91928 RepID=A0A0D2B0C6_9EURO|nr:uncharacterized protein PV08_09445 [Exophiala spinifera]KIW12170.1 hypothetical protein PV08_09445 [Exophiala spinifera]
MSSTTPPSRRSDVHLTHLSHALDLARKSPPKPTNFRVGCVIVSYPPPADTTTTGTVLSTGYTLELDGNTHAEQCALSKLAHSHGLEDESRLHELGGEGGLLAGANNVTLYTTLEPCGLRLSGNKPCVERIIETRKKSGGGGGGGGGGIARVIFGAREPGTFVRDSKSLQRLDAEGVPWEYVHGLEDEILSVAMEGHDTNTKTATDNADASHTAPEAGSATTARGIVDISPEERRRQESLPRNPKKRMMETV